MARRGVCLRTTLIALICVGCAREPAPPQRLPILLGGCEFTSAGCGIDTGASIRLFVPHLDAPPHIDGARIKQQIRHFDGVTYHLDPAVQASQLTVTGVQKGQRVQARQPLFRRTVSIFEGVIRTMRSGQLEAAQAAFDAFTTAQKQSAAGRAVSGRLALRRGQFELAIAQLTRAYTAHVNAGEVSAASDALAAAAYIWVYRLGDLKAAQRHLKPARWHAEGEARRHRLLAGIEARRGRNRQSLRHTERAWYLARRIGNADLQGTIASVIAAHRLAFGQFEASIAILESALSAGPKRACVAQGLRSNLGWARLRQASVQGLDERQAHADLDAAAAYESCSQPTVRANAFLNQAFGALERGKPVQAKAALEAALAVANTQHLQPWILLGQASIDLLQKRPKAALQRYLAMSTDPVVVGVDASWRTWMGRADAYAQLGQRPEQIKALQAAEALLDSTVATVPAQMGRAAFVVDRQRSARALVGALLKLNLQGAALTAARRARARVWLGTERSLRADTPQRAAALVAYRETRAELEADQALDLTRTQAEQAAARQARHQKARAAVRLLDAALEGSRQHALPTRSPNWPSALMHPIPAGWAVFIWQGQRLEVHTIAASDTTDLQTVTQQIWNVITPHARAAGAVDLLPMGPLRAVDFHGLPDANGRPIAASIRVRYALDLSTRPPAEQRGVVIVADPRLDLPGAVVEGRAVRQALGDRAMLLRGDAATPAALTAALKTARRLHYAGHGVFSEEALASQLPLAEGTALTAADILALPQVPAEVVLSGCETSQTGTGLVDTVGLAQAFLAAGANAVIATTRKVKDTEAQAMSAALYDPAAPADLGGALHFAQKRLLASKKDWQSFRVLTR